MTYDHLTDTDSRSDAESSGEQSLYGAPRHEAHGDDDEQTMYGEPQHEFADDTDADAWDIGLLFAHVRSGPAAPDELGSRTNPSAAETTER